MIPLISPAIWPGRSQDVKRLGGSQLAFHAKWHWTISLRRSASDELAAMTSPIGAIAPGVLDRRRRKVRQRGKGFGSQKSRGLGIVAMRERADLLGGTIEFLRPAPGGTLVRLRVPFE